MKATGINTKSIECFVCRKLVISLLFFVVLRQSRRLRVVPKSTQWLAGVTRLDALASERKLREQPQ
jgi:hypothetical protein